MINCLSDVYASPADSVDMVELRLEMKFFKKKTDETKPSDLAWAPIPKIFLKAMLVWKMGAFSFFSSSHLDDFSNSTYSQTKSQTSLYVLVS